MAKKDQEPDVRSMTFGELAEAAYGGMMSEEDEKLFAFYEEDLAGVSPLGREEEKRLTELLLSGDEAQKEKAAERLTEGNLRWVVTLARGYADGSVPLSDLIQEGNLALFMGIRSYAGGDLSALLEKDIARAMQGLIKEQTGFERAGDSLADLANLVLDTVKEMEEEIDEAVTAAALSKKLGIPESRIDEVLRISAKAMKNLEN